MLEKFPTSEELGHLRNHVVIPYVLRVLARDRRNIAKVAHIPDLYTDAIDRAIKDAETHAKAIRAHFRKYGIKVYEESKDDKGVMIRYVCRGYHSEVTYDFPFIKARAWEKMRELLKI